LPNRGTSARWTIQVRHSDLADFDFISAGYPMGDHTNIAHHNYLPGWKPDVKEEAP
jgi:hypothetical protein